MAKGAIMQEQMVKNNTIAKISGKTPPVFKSVINATHASFCTYARKDVMLLGGSVGVATNRSDGRTVTPNAGAAAGDYVIFGCPQRQSNVHSFKVFTPFSSY